MFLPGYYPIVGHLPEVPIHRCPGFIQLLGDLAGGIRLTFGHHLQYPLSDVHGPILDTEVIILTHVDKDLLLGVLSM